MGARSSVLLPVRELEAIKQNWGKEEKAGLKKSRTFLYCGYKTVGLGFFFHMVLLMQRFERKLGKCFRDPLRVLK